MPGERHQPDDQDQPSAGYRPYLFGARQHARLLLLRSEVLEARLGRGRLVGDLSPDESDKAADLTPDR